MKTLQFAIALCQKFKNNISNFANNSNGNATIELVSFKSLSLQHSIFTKAIVLRKERLTGCLHQELMP